MARDIQVRTAKGYHVICFRAAMKNQKIVSAGKDIQKLGHVDRAGKWRSHCRKQ